MPPDLNSYGDAGLGVLEIIGHRASVEPFNVVATALFFLAIVHTFLSGRFKAWSHRLQEEHSRKVELGRAPDGSSSIGAGILHFLGEVEVIFGWRAVALGVAMVAARGWDTFVHYVTERNFTEPVFVVVVMALAASRPILVAADAVIARVARLFGNSVSVWWLTIMSLGPVLASFITEPTAMTISALLLSRRVFSLPVSSRFRYATLGLLFVNVSVGGTLTPFAAPPILVLAHTWHWDLAYTLGGRELHAVEAEHRLQQLRRKVQADFIPREEVADAVGVALGIADIEVRFLDTVRERAATMKERLRRAAQESSVHEGAVTDELIDQAVDERFEEVAAQELANSVPGLLPASTGVKVVDPAWDEREDPVAWWVTVVHGSFLVWTVATAQYPAMFVGGLLLFLGFASVTGQHQNRTDLKPPLLVGFFLAGLVVHGGLQGWWIAPLLAALTELPLMLGATVLTAFNDNAAITYLSSLVPDFSPRLQYAVVAGAVAGGGLTVIANAPNPAGVSILGRHFTHGVSALKLLLHALLPTAIMWLLFGVLR